LIYIIREVNSVESNQLSAYNGSKAWAYRLEKRCQRSFVSDVSGQLNRWDNSVDSQVSLAKVGVGCGVDGFIATKGDFSNNAGA